MTTISSGNVGLARQEGEKSQESQRRSWSARRNEYKFMICSYYYYNYAFPPGAPSFATKTPPDPAIPAIPTPPLGRKNIRRFHGRVDCKRWRV